MASLLHVVLERGSFSPPSRGGVGASGHCPEQAPLTEWWEPAGALTDATLREGVRLLDLARVSNSCFLYALCVLCG